MCHRTTQLLVPIRPRNAASSSGEMQEGHDLLTAGRRNDLRAPFATMDKTGSGLSSAVTDASAWISLELVLVAHVQKISIPV